VTLTAVDLFFSPTQNLPFKEMSSASNIMLLLVC
jgi:hypothetical protein